MTTGLIAVQPASAQTIPTVGSACTSAQATFWEQSGICPASTGVWQRPAFQFGPAIAACASGTAGMVQWTGSALQYCNGTSWANFSGGTGAYNFPAGAVGAPGLYVTGDSDTGFYQATANTVSLTAGGAEVIRADNSAAVTGADYFKFTPSAAGSPGVITMSAAGSDTDVSIALTPKGNGIITLNPTGYVMISGGAGIRIGSSDLIDIYSANNGITLANNLQYAWSSTGLGNGAQDIALWRDAAGIMGQRVGTAAQAFRVYNTYTDASNYERGVIDWKTNSNLLTIGAQAAGTGTLRNVDIVGGNVGINSATPGATLDILAPSTATSGSTYGMQLNGAQSVANTGTFMGAYFGPSYTAATGNTLANLVGTQAFTNNTNSGTVSLMTAVSAISRNGSTGQVTNMLGVDTTPQNISSGSVGTMYGVRSITTKIGTGPVTVMEALYAKCVNSNATGTVGTCYGLYIDTPDTTGAITNKYGVYQTDSASTNYFAGNVGIGTAPSTYPLDVNGSSRIQNGSLGFSNNSGISISDTAGSATATITVDSANNFLLRSNNASGNYYLGLLNASATGRIYMQTQGANRLVINSAGNVGIGSSSTPNHLLDVQGNIGQAAGSYHNFGSTDGTTGYGLRDNGGTIEIKNSGGSWGVPVINGGSSTVAFPAGAVGAPGLYVTGDSDTGLYQSTANTLSLTAGGAEVARFDNSAGITGADYFKLTPGATGSPGIITIAAAGSDTDVNINITPKGVGGVGIGTASPTHALTLSSTASSNPTNGATASGGKGIALYNTTDQTTNYQRGTIYMDTQSGDNTLMIRTEKGGTGVQPSINLAGNGVGMDTGTGRVSLVSSNVSVDILTQTEKIFKILGDVRATANTTNILLGQFGNFTTTTGTSRAVQAYGAFAPTSGTAKFIGLDVAPIINQTGTATGNYTAFQIQPTITAATGTSQLLMDVGTAASPGLFVVTGAGNVGIGTNAPNEQLEIAASAGGRFIASDGGGSSRHALLIQSPTTSQIYGRINAYNYGGSTAMNLVLNDSGGNVGIGSTSPSQALDVKGAGINLNDGTNGMDFLSTAGTGEMPAGGRIQGATGKNFWITGTDGGAIGSKVAVGYYNQTQYYSAFEVANVASGFGSLVLMKSGGNVGIGTTAPGAQLDIRAPSTQTAANVTGLNVGGAQSTANTGTYYGVYTNPTYTAVSGNTLNAQYAITGIPQNSSSGTVTSMIGVRNAPQNIGTGTVTNMYGEYATPTNSSTGTVGTMYGFYSQCANTNASGAVTSCYGLYIEAPSGSGVITNKYGIYQNDANSNNYFAGKVGVGTTSPQATLDVNGYAKLKINASAPATCSSSIDGALALTHVYTLCACNGGMPAWVQANDGVTACAW